MLYLIILLPQYRWTFLSSGGNWTVTNLNLGSDRLLFRANHCILQQKNLEIASFFFSLTLDSEIHFFYKHKAYKRTEAEIHLKIRSFKAYTWAESILKNLYEYDRTVNINKSNIHTTFQTKL